MNNIEDDCLIIIWNCYFLDEVEFFLFSLLENCFVLFFQSKFQKHQAFEAEVSANQERVLETINLAEGKNDTLQTQSFTPEADMEMC